MDDDSTFEDEGGGESAHQRLLRRNAEFDRQLKKTPGDAQVWLDFLAFQDELGVGRHASRAEKRGTHEVKLSILERALGVKELQGDERLLLAYLACVTELWESAKVLDKWREVLAKHPGRTGLWTAYVAFRQTDGTTFSVPKMVEVFEECLAVLRSKARGLTSSRPGECVDFATQGEGIVDVHVDLDREELEQNMLYLFLRACLMLRQAGAVILYVRFATTSDRDREGYHERAISAFQALIELNFYMPDRLRRIALNSEAVWREQVLGELESFWDSEAPRIGEERAKGWRETDIDNAIPPAPCATVSDPPARVSDAFEAWMANERYRSTATRRPRRATDPETVDSEDPFCVVFFGDVRSFLFTVDSPIVRSQLVYAFLILLGVPLTAPDASTSSAFSIDPFLHSEIIENPNARRKFWPKMQMASRLYDTIGGEPMEPRRESGMTDPFGSPFKVFPMASEFLFASEPRWFNFFERDDLERVDVDFIRLIISMHSGVWPR
jgi:NRDE-2, necessary for RNA interference